MKTYKYKSLIKNIFTLFFIIFFMFYSCLSVAKGRINNSFISSISLKHSKNLNIKKITEKINVISLGAKGDCVQDDSLYIQQALDSGAREIILPKTKCAYLIDSIFIPAGVLLKGNGATIMAKSKGVANLITLRNNSEIREITIDGNGKNRLAGDIISSVNQKNITISNLVIKNFNSGRAISIINSNNFIVQNNTIKNISGPSKYQAINITFSNYGNIINNEISGAMHGIQWWGGDSAQSTVIGMSNLTIRKNRIKNVVGGIWGSLGSHITVSENEIENAADVGIDFEGCQDFIATKNFVTAAANGGIAIFFSSKRGIISKNSIIVKNTIGLNNGIWSTAAEHRDIFILDNSIINHTGKGQGIYIDTGAERFNILRNTLNGNGIYIHNSSEFNISENFISNGAIILNGSSNNKVSSNNLMNKNTLTGNTPLTAAIVIAWASKNYQAQHNLIIDNKIIGWKYSITDDCSGDHASFNNISNNLVSGILSHRGTNGWTGRMIENFQLQNNNKAAVIKSF